MTKVCNRKIAPRRDLGDVTPVGLLPGVPYDSLNPNGRYYP